MKRVILSGIAALVGVAMAPVAHASPIIEAEYVGAVQEFGWIIDDASVIRTAHSICASLDRGAEIADIKSWLHHEFVNTNTRPHDGGYLGAMFIRLAAHQYCPWTAPMDWNI